MVLRTERNLYWVALGLITAGLLIACFAGYIDLSLAVTTTVLAGMWVVYLGWRCWSLRKVLRSTASVLRRGCASGDVTKTPDTQALNQAIEQCFRHQTDRVGELEKQLEDLRLQVQLSQRQKANSEAIIYSIRDAVIVSDSFDRLVMANAAAGKVFGFDINASQQKDIAELIDNSTFVELVHQSRQSRSLHVRHEIELNVGDRPRTFDCIISCIFYERRQVGGVVAVLHDITREKEISRMKNDFVSHVSHELKTPLSSIMAYVEMLMDGEAGDEETCRRFYSVIQEQAQRLRRLIDNILNISRIESGLIKVNRKPVSVTILIKEAVQMIRSYAGEKDIELIEQTPIVFDQVYADRDMITQVIINLLSNAVKYTPNGGTVRIDSRINQADGLVRVAVSDTGVGIPETELEHIFDKFYRVGENNKCAKGTGLGLNLVKQIVEKVHNGRMFVSSEAGKGSTFSFELPVGTEQIVETGSV